MAQRKITLLVDDLDGGDADETVLFGLDGVQYEIDLTTANAAKLRDAIGVWVGSARKVGRAGRGGRRRAAAGGDAQAMRDWGKANGFEVSNRGRISAQLRAAYEAAH
ncbi:MAG: Lsr2 family protein [Micrococcales bacterium]|nr:Lsr2 family protein [Micrococcales bacterium]MCL2667682.1 Lsr2 family protein [Micrococcales bacterium]